MIKAQRQIVILGGGFGGLATAQSISGRFRVNLVDRREAFEYLPAIHELLSRSKTPDDLRLPLGELGERMGFVHVRAEVDRIDAERAEVLLATGQRLPYDAVVVALGGEDATHGIEGVREHAIGFKSVAECEAIASRLDALAARHEGGDVVIVGGGFEGVEALGEALRRHRSSGRLRIVLLDAADRLVPGLPRGVDGDVRSLAASHGVRFRFGERVARVSSSRVTLDSGGSLPADLVIWTGGIVGSPVIVRSGLSTSKGGWLPVRPTLQATTDDRIFAVGDAASFDDGLARQAYHALDMGRVAAGNLSRLLSGEPLEPFVPSSKPMLISFGDLASYLVTGAHAVKGSAFNLAKEAVYQMVTARFDPPGLSLSSRFARRLSRGGGLSATASLSALLGMGRFRILS
jgi:NADH dehydrogenase